MNLFKYNHTNFFKFFLILVFLAIVFGSNWNLSLSHTNIIELKNIYISVAFLSAILLLVTSNINKIKYNINLPIFTLLLFFLYASISFLWIGHDQIDQDFFLRKWFLYFYSFLTISICYKYFDIKQHSHFLIRLITLSLLMLTAIYLSQKFFDFPSEDILLRTEYKHFAATFGNKNGLSQILLLFYPFAFLLTLSPKNKLDLVIGFLSIISTIFVITFIKSNIANFALIVETFLLIWLIFKIKANSLQISKLFLIILLSISILFFLFIFHNIILETVKEIITRIGSEDTPRKILWNNMFLSIVENPFFGSGLGSLVPELQRIGESILIEKGHNDFFELILELGFVGLLFLGVFFITVLLNFMKLNKDEINLFDYIALISLSGITLSAVTSWPFQHFAPVIVTSILVAVFLKKISPISPAILSIKPNRFFKIISYFIAVLILILSPIVHSNWAINHSNLNNSINDISQDSDLNNRIRYLSNYRSPLQITWLVNPLAFKEEYFKKRVSLALATSIDKDNSFGLWEYFNLMIKDKNIKEAEITYQKMKDRLPFNPQTYDAGMKLCFIHKDANCAAKVFDALKKISRADSKRFFRDYRYYVFLFRWANLTKNYDDMIFAYDELIELREKQNGNELIMADYYFVNKQYEKSIPHIIYLLKKDKNLIKKEIIDFLQKEGFLNSQEN